MEALSIKLNNEGYTTIGIVTPDSYPMANLSNVEHIAVIPLHLIKYLSRINVFILSDQDSMTIFPESSKVLGCVHSFYFDDNTNFLSGYIRYLPFLDGLISPIRINNTSKNSIVDFWTGFIDNNLSYRKNGIFNFISVGYPRLSLLHEQIDNLNIEPDAIVYAPVRHDYAPECGGNRIRNYGSSIIAMLLSRVCRH